MKYFPPTVFPECLLRYFISISKINLINEGFNSDFHYSVYFSLMIKVFNFSFPIWNVLDWFVHGCCPANLTVLGPLFLSSKALSCDSSYFKNTNEEWIM